MTLHLMIPARYGSSRLPGKVLLPIAGKTILEHVYDRARESGIGKISILCDDSRVEEIAHSFCDSVIKTSPECQSGTERIISVLEHLNLAPTDVVINVQGDEPFIEPEKIQLLARLMTENTELPMATLAHRIEDEKDLHNPNVVKVVLDQREHALYFSRSLIPWSDTPDPKNYLRHIGLYAYRVSFLHQLQGLPISALQLCEKLEQLTVLYQGYKIKVGICEKPRYTDINTLEDYEGVVRTPPQ